MGNVRLQINEGGAPRGGGAKVVVTGGSRLLGWAWSLLRTTVPVLACGALLYLLMPESPGQQSLQTLSQPEAEPSRCFVHIKAKARMMPGAGFTALSAAAVPQDLVIWRGEDVEMMWAVEKAGTVAISDSFVGGIFSRSNTNGMTGKAHTCGALAYPTFGFIGHFLWGLSVLPLEDNIARIHGAQVAYSYWTASSGVEKLTVSITPGVGVKAVTDVNDQVAAWLSPGLSKEYVFDVETKRMEKVRVYCCAAGGAEVNLFETLSMEYVPMCDGVAAFSAYIASLDSDMGGNCGLDVENVIRRCEL